MTLLSPSPRIKFIQVILSKSSDSENYITNIFLEFIPCHHLHNILPSASPFLYTSETLVLSISIFASVNSTHTHVLYVPNQILFYKTPSPDAIAGGVQTLSCPSAPSHWPLLLNNDYHLTSKTALFLLFFHL